MLLKRNRLPCGGSSLAEAVLPVVRALTASFGAETILLESITWPPYVFGEGAAADRRACCSVASPGEHCSVRVSPVLLASAHALPHRDGPRRDA